MGSPDNRILSQIKSPLRLAYPRQLTLLLDESGAILDFPDAGSESAYFGPLIDALRKTRSVADLFESPEGRPCGPVLKEHREASLSSPGTHYRFDESPESFYTSLPMYGIRLFPVPGGKFVGVVTTSNLIPNLFERASGGVIYADRSGRLAGFTHSILDFFKDETTDARSLLDRPLDDLMAPSPSLMQKEAVSEALKAGKGKWENRIDREFREAQAAGGFFMSFPVALDLEHTDCRVEVEWSPESRQAPFVVFGDAPSKAGDAFLDRNGYLIGPDLGGNTVLLKKAGFALACLPLAASGKPAACLTVEKIGSAFFLELNGDRILAFYDFDFLQRGGAFLSLYLRPGRSCALKKVRLMTRPGLPVEHRPYQTVELKNRAKTSCLLSRFQSFALNASYRHVAGYRLQDITTLKQRLDGLEKDYQRERREARRLSLLLHRYQRKEEMFLGSGEWAQKLRDRAERLAASAATLLIQGATGTGKEVLARFIHEKSPFAKGPFVKIDCSTIPATLMESELFGYERGAFTGAAAQRIGLLERADKGTVFLDEINNLTLDTQAKLLQFLQDFKIVRVGGSEPVPLTVRVLCAANKDIRHSVAQGLFREDLYYRIAVIRLDLSLLRDRLEDLPELSLAFLEHFNGIYSKNIRGISAEAFGKMAAHPWPGNIRELRNVIEQAVIFCDREEIGADQIFMERPGVFSGRTISGKDNRRKISPDRAAIEAGLRAHGGSVAKLALEWGVTRRALYYNCKALGLDPRRYRAAKAASVST